MDVITCGFPMGTSFMIDEVGNLTSSFSRGIVSSVIPWSKAPIDQLEGVQLDIRVAPGNSGGPVVSLSTGRVFAALKGYGSRISAE
jgi:S1-C subfamily serine protease